MFHQGYLVYTKKIQQQAIMNSAPPVGSDQAAAPLKNTKPNLSNDGSAINQQAPVGTTPDNNPATTNAGSTTNPIATDSSVATNQGQIDMSAKASIKISVSSQPAGAGIWIDGKDSGFTTPAVVTVTPNVETNLQLKKDGYFVYETKKIFKETTNFNTALQVAPRVAYLNIDVKNSNGNAVIYVNGQKVNESLPVKKYPVPADTDIVIMAYNPLNKQRDEAKIRLPASKEQNIELVLGRQGTSATNSVNKK